jgi:D-alanine transaminase
MLEPGRSPQWAFVNGNLLPASQARLPLEERGLQFAESLYEVVAVVRGKPFRLAEHVERMLRGARELGLAPGVPPLASWERMVAELWDREPHQEAILYAQLTGGEAPREHLPASAQRPTFFAYLRPFAFPSPAQCAQGIAAITVPETRWARRDLKTTMLLPAVLAKRQAQKRQAAEAIFVGQDGYVNEGASSNVCVVTHGAVASPPPGERLLEGVTLQVVAELCGELGIPFARRWVSLAELKGAEEVFIASTTTLLMPVVKLDGQLVGGGQPGPVSLRLAYHFQRVFRGSAPNQEPKPF